MGEFAFIAGIITNQGCNLSLRAQRGNLIDLLVVLLSTRDVFCHCQRSAAISLFPTKIHMVG